MVATATRQEMTDLQPPFDFRPARLDPGDLPGEEVERRKRRAGAAVALACVGVHLDPWAALGLMLPFDAPQAARDYLRSGVSTCALLARGYLLLLGADHLVLNAPYLRRVGRAVSDVVQVARDAGAWRTPEPGATPHPGDVVLIGHMTHDGRPDPAYVRGTKATEHVLLVTALRGHLLDSVDGGQPGVERRTRQVMRVGRELWLGHTEHGTGPDGRPLVGRRVVGWLSIADMALPREALLPDWCLLDG